MTSAEPAPTTGPDASAGRPADVPSPIEATLRILQSSVPYLIGAAVVRQGSGGGSVAGQIGRVPWLFDRRLTELQLSEDALPMNQPVLLDWPVPHQAEWVGVQPRLLIARLTAFERTVGVLLGTLVTREQLDAKTREAIELSCQLIASAVATESLVRESEQQARRLRVLNELQRALSSTLDARALGRLLRDAMSEVLEHIGFSVSLFHQQRDEIAYRYRVVDVDALSQDARRPIDDGPTARAARDAKRAVFTREVDVPLESGKSLRRQVSVVQFPLLVAGAPIGIVTVQAFRPDGFAEEELSLAKVVVDTSANYFAHARRVGLRRPGPEEPNFTLVSGTGPVAPAPAARTPNAPSTPPPADTPSPGAKTAIAATPDAATRQAAPASSPRPPAVSAPAMPAPAAARRDPEQVLRELLAGAAKLSTHAFVVLADESTGLLRAHLTSVSPAMAELDRATGIGRGTFLIGIDDRSNAIARACRERRVVSVGWLHEVVQPILQWHDALALERLLGGGHCSIVPLVVGERAAGALVLGPTAADLPAAELERAAVLASRAAAELAGPVSPADALRLSALQGLGPTD